MCVQEYMKVIKYDLNLIFLNTCGAACWKLKYKMMLRFETRTSFHGVEVAFMGRLHVHDWLPLLKTGFSFCLYGDVLSYIRIPPVCQDVQLRHRLEEHKWSVVYCFCCGFPCDSPDNLPKQVSFTHNQLFTFLQYKTGKLCRNILTHAIWLFTESSTPPWCSPWRRSNPLLATTSSTPCWWCCRLFTSSGLAWSYAWSTSYWKAMWESAAENVDLEESIYIHFLKKWTTHIL